MRILRTIVAPSTAFVAFGESKLVTNLSGTKPYFFKSLRIKLSAAHLFLLV